MMLRVEFRSTEVNEWNTKNGFDINENMFEEKVFNVINNLVDISNEYWDSYEAWYDKIYNVTYDLSEKISSNKLEKIKENITTIMEIDIEKIYVDDNK
ncbi:hypothetical protein ADU80_05005 [Clostridium botulinum]|uniref:hypothetical protein n=1 Tax=Clostridium botulinum TaxID=1491 RepID=UPI0002075AAE|nr:hypothetical protein [Clostridium botulinum]AEB77621.1 hypothetical protein CbC4_7010 [Clostridium botulinum BKT015925]KOA76623.1 hypothetical protein ADU78_05960 [Clostridium botulinum]KOA86419.1 hypothetical protein ADU80_05005 [Clostridium botulinum]KOC34080.1 hypothetical protein ADU82_10895 [Clostridium botulinum]KOC42103.1 hypothetical protein ADU84_06925 [Clostridium botulinum]